MFLPGAFHILEFIKQYLIMPSTSAKEADSHAPELTFPKAAGPPPPPIPPPQPPNSLSTVPNPRNKALIALLEGKVIKEPAAG